MYDDILDDILWGMDQDPTIDPHTGEPYPDEDEEEEPET